MDCEAVSHGATPTAGSEPQHVPSDTQGMFTPGAIRFVHPRADGDAATADDDAATAAKKVTPDGIAEAKCVMV